MLLCRPMRFPPKEAIAVLIMSSQKTMPFAVSIIALLPASLGSKGLLTLPPLVAQVGTEPDFPLICWAAWWPASPICL